MLREPGFFYLVAALYAVYSILMVTSSPTIAAWFQPSHTNSNQQERGKRWRNKSKGPKQLPFKECSWKLPFDRSFLYLSTTGPLPATKEGGKEEREALMVQISSKVRPCSGSWEIILDLTNHLGRNWSPFHSFPNLIKTRWKSQAGASGTEHLLLSPFNRDLVSAQSSRNAYTGRADANFCFTWVAVLTNHSGLY